MGYLGIPFFMEVMLPYGEGCFIANSRYYMALIGECELVLCSFKKCSSGTDDILGIALVQRSYVILH